MLHNIYMNNFLSNTKNKIIVLVISIFIILYSIIIIDFRNKQLNENKLNTDFGFALAIIGITISLEIIIYISFNSK